MLLGVCRAVCTTPLACVRAEWRSFGVVNILFYFSGVVVSGLQAAAPPQYQPFLIDLMGTQQFCAFIDQRCEAKAKGSKGAPSLGLGLSTILIGLEYHLDWA